MISLDTVAEPPTLTVEAGYSKRRRRDVQPIKRELAISLFSGESPRGCLRRTTVAWGMEGVGRGDAAARPGGRRDCLPDERGHVFDFHALRHQFISTLVQAGVHPKEAQELARHSMIPLTMDRYAYVEKGRLSQRFNRLPSPGLQTDPRVEKPEEVALAGPPGEKVVPHYLTKTPGRPCPGHGVAARGGRGAERASAKRKPLRCKGLGTSKAVLAGNGLSDADGTRTRNHWIDSPVL